MSPTHLERIEAGMRIVLAFNEAFNRHDVAGMMELMSEECIVEYTNPTPDGAVYTGKEAVTRFWQNFFGNSPHARIDIEEIFGLGLRCILRWRLNWIDEAGNHAHVRGVDLFQVKNSLISEILSYSKRPVG